MIAHIIRADEVKAGDRVLVGHYLCEVTDTQLIISVTFGKAPLVALSIAGGGVASVLHYQADTLLAVRRDEPGAQAETVRPSMVKRFQWKPQPLDKPDGLFAARYVHGEPLDDVRKVAQMAFQGEVAECELRRGWALVAVYTDVPDDHPARPDVEIIWDGDWLTYSERYQSLCHETTNGLAHWYEEVPDAGES